jgi:hypothetical protein
MSLAPRPTILRHVKDPYEFKEILHSHNLAKFIQLRY